MPYTFKDLNSDVRRLVFTTGESRNLVIPHDKSIVDALVDIQTWVECFQYDNTTIVPQCATNYNCGLTSFDFQRAQIKRLSVIDKINPETREEDAGSPDDWCSEIVYNQVDACYMQSYLSKSNHRGCCLPITQFFAIPEPFCRKGYAPTPTDEGVPEGLPTLPLGYHYPQESTNATCRALQGVWAIERGRILLAPWIQSTETIVVRWDGIKREWVDGDLVENDPKLIKAIKLYLQWETSRDWGDIKGDPEKFRTDYAIALADLMRDCREETRVRGCEPSLARGSDTGKLSLFYNDERQATAQCPAGKTGDIKTVTIPAGTVGSSYSKADANNRAFQQAQQEAQALLVCTDIPVTYYNTQQIATASCEQESDAPAPDGSPTSVTIPAGEYSSTVSQAAADALALAAAESQAQEQLSCVFWNREQSFTADCAVTETVAAHTHSSSISQDDADSRAFNAAKVAAEDQCPDVFYNTRQSFTQNGICMNPPNGGCSFAMLVVVEAGQYTSTVSQSDANSNAHNAGLLKASQTAAVLCAGSPPCGGSVNVTIP